MRDPRSPLAAALTGLALGSILGACEAELEGVPEGALARVGEVVIEAEEVEATQAQLGAFGQARFRGPHGHRALLDTLIEQELMVQAARDAGLGDDPRVEWAVLEELADLQRTAMLERRLPRAEVAEDEAALRARYDQMQGAFIEPELRSMRAVKVANFEAGEAALARLEAGEVTLAELGEVVRTPMMKRDDAEYPAYHRVLFDPELEVGDLLPVPVLAGSVVVVGAVDAIEPARRLGFDDPELREQLVSAERDARLAAVEAELLAELAERYPE